MDKFQAQREQICQVCHLLYDRGYVVSNDGNVSLRVGKDRILVTPSGVCKGRMEPDMLVLCDLEGRVLAGDRWPSSESEMHRMVLQSRPDVNSVVHAHPPFSTAFAVCRRPLDRRYLTETISGLGEVPVAEFAMPSTSQVADSVRPYVGDHNAVLLANHGSLAWGRDLWSAFDRLEAVEQTARIYYYVEQMGGGVEFTPDQARELLSLSGHYQTLAGRRSAQ